MVSMVGVVAPTVGHPLTPGVAIPEINAVLTRPLAVGLTPVVVTIAVENVGEPTTCPGNTHAVCISSTAFPVVADE
jgi:hypothetical protein